MADSNIVMWLLFFFPFCGWTSQKSTLCVKKLFEFRHKQIFFLIKSEIDTDEIKPCFEFYPVHQHWFWCPGILPFFRFFSPSPSYQSPTPVALSQTCYTREVVNTRTRTPSQGLVLRDGLFISLTERRGAERTHGTHWNFEWGKETAPVINAECRNRPSAVSSLSRRGRRCVSQEKCVCAELS